MVRIYAAVVEGRRMNLQRRRKALAARAKQELQRGNPASLAEDRAVTIPTVEKARHDVDQNGFAILAVLGTLLMVGLMLSAVDQLSISSYKMNSGEGRRERETWLLQAGLNRAVKALITPGDPMRERLFRQQALVWEFQGEKLTLVVEAESEKTDINTARPTLVMSKVRAFLPDLPSVVLDDIGTLLERARNQRNALISPELLLPLARRFGLVAKVIKRQMTVLSGQSTPSVSTRADDAQPEHNRGQSNDADLGGDVPSLPRPIYNISASLSSPEASKRDGSGRSASVALILAANDQTKFKLVDGHL